MKNPPSAVVHDPLNQPHFLRSGLEGPLYGPLKNNGQPGLAIPYDPAKGFPLVETPTHTAPVGMSPEQFTFWMQGIVFGARNGLTKEQYDCVKSVLSTIKIGAPL